MLTNPSRQCQRLHLSAVPYPSTIVIGPSSSVFETFTLTFQLLEDRSYMVLFSLSLKTKE